MQISTAKSAIAHYEEMDRGDDEQYIEWRAELIKVEDEAIKVLEKRRQAFASATAKLAARIVTAAEAGAAEPVLE